MIISAWGLLSIETRQFLLYRCHEKNVRDERSGCFILRQKCRSSRTRIKGRSNLEGHWQKNVLLFSKYFSGIVWNLSARGTPLYKPYSYVPPQRVGFLRRFGMKTCIYFAHFGLESGIVFKEGTGVYERICLFSSKRKSIIRIRVDL